VTEKKPKTNATDWSEVANSSRWVSFVSSRSSATVQSSDDQPVMAWPHLIVREVLLLQIMVILLTVFSLWFDAPLEELANPEHSPNPAKAPWYFLGLQELLHYFPPVVAGVLIPALVVLALIVLPYWKVNVNFQPLWGETRARSGIWLVTVFALISACTIPFHAWPIFIPTVVIAGAMSMPALLRFRGEWAQRWAAIPLADWLMIWFVCLTVTLTVIGVFFRGPEWQWILPWRDGIYY